MSASDLIFPFGCDAQSDRQVRGDVAGIKGANLITMANLGLPVPAGFVIGIEMGARVAAGEDALGAAERAAIKQKIKQIEAKMKRRFGDAHQPLLLSVRSGAAVSMPGMMDSVLNLGLNNQTVEALAKETGDERFAWDTYRRFVQSFAHVVLDIDEDDFEIVMEQSREAVGVDSDSELPATVLKDITKTYLDFVEQHTGSAFPQDAFDQLDFALLAVFNSWNTPRAQRYRDIQGVSHDGGTAAIVQAMVFGNRDTNSCTGVYFTRNPSTGEARAYGEYLPNAQGEDVVSGIRTPMDITEFDRERSWSDNPSMETSMPTAFAELMKVGTLLENHFKDLQEIEFTVESGNLYLLQTRDGKRAPRATLRVAVELAQEGLISRNQAVERCHDDLLAPMLVSKIDARAGNAPIGKGLPASPGAAIGKIVFTSQEAVSMRKSGQDCILVRPETDPKDVHGMDAATGILTTRGGMTSHAAVVARGMGKPCITAAMSLKVDLVQQTLTAAGAQLHTGDVISIDGSTGQVFAGEQDVVVPKPDGALATLLGWKSELQACN